MNLEEILNLVVIRTGEGVVRLGSLARVFRSHKEQDVISRINGREAVEVQIFKEADANIVSLAERVKGKLLGSPEQQAYARALAEGSIPDPDEQLKALRAQREASAGEKPKSEKPSTGGERHGGPPPRRGRRPMNTRGLHSGEMDPVILALQAQADEKKRKLAFVAHHLPEGLEVKVLSDQSRFIKESISEVRTSGLIGGCVGCAHPLSLPPEDGLYPDHRPGHPHLGDRYLRPHVHDRNLAEHHVLRGARPWDRHARGQLDHRPRIDF